MNAAVTPASVRGRVGRLRIRRLFTSAPLLDAIGKQLGWQDRRSRPGALLGAGGVALEMSSRTLEGRREPKARASGVRQSTRRRGDCRHDAVAESFYANLRAELADHEHSPLTARRSPLAPRHEAELFISDYIDILYNVERRQSVA